MKEWDTGDTLDGIKHCFDSCSPAAAAEEWLMSHGESEAISIHCLKVWIILVGDRVDITCKFQRLIIEGCYSSGQAGCGCRGAGLAHDKSRVKDSIQSAVFSWTMPTTHWHSTSTRRRRTFSSRLSQSCSTDRPNYSFVPQGTRLFNASQ